MNGFLIHLCYFLLYCDIRLLKVQNPCLKPSVTLSNLILQFQIVVCHLKMQSIYVQSTEIR